MKYSTGADKSPYDIRTFTYDKADDTAIPNTGGVKYSPKDIEDQHRVGICTAIAVTMNAHKVTGIDFSDDFQYLCQKKFYDLNWREGSSAFHALKVAKNIGLLKQSDWTHTTIEDRKLSYTEYIKKLQAIPDEEIERLKVLAKEYQIAAYARVPVTRDNLAIAINESKAGIITRFVVGREWYNHPIEPLRRALNPISGHIVTTSNYSGGSFRIANSWGAGWADKGTAYYLLSNNAPTEAWRMWFKEVVPPVIVEKMLSREEAKGKILDLLQQIIVLITKWW